MSARSSVFGVLIGGHQNEHLLGRWGYALVFAVAAGQSAGVPVPGTTALAAAGGMAARRFLMFNLIGGVLWAVLNGLGYFYLGHALSTASTPVDVGLVILGLAWIGGSFIYLRRRAAPLVGSSQQQE